MKNIQKLLISIILLVCVSCDTSKPLIIEDNKHTLHSQCGTISIGGFSFGTLLMIAYTFKGQCLINTDSLKVEADSRDDTITNIHFRLNNKDFTGNKIITVGGEELSFFCNLLPVVPYQRTTGKILLLPSNFITCGSKPVITDTIRIQLKN